MPMSEGPTLDAYWGMLKPHLRNFSPAEQRAAVALYRELARGQPVDDAQLGGALGICSAESRRLLQGASIQSMIYADAQGRVLGFGGLATAPMHHRFEVDGCNLWTWCAWDSLFIPEILRRAARVTSSDPESAELVRLVVTPESIKSVEPDQAVISFIRPDAGVFGTSATDVMARFCHFIYFFASRASGEHWIAKNPGTFLYSLDDGFALAKRFNASSFGLELGRHMLEQTPSR